jgi:two-component system sensor histidine kinase and response regulator WspE
VKKNEPEDLSRLSLMELFRAETENQTETISAALLELERNPGSAQLLEALMRAAHSLKGAARIVNQGTAVSVAHAMEDCFVAAQQGRVQLRREQIDILFRGVDLLLTLAKPPENNAVEGESSNAEAARQFLAAMAEITAGNAAQSAAPSQKASAAPPPQTLPAQNQPAERLLRLTAQNLNRLLGLAGESMVESRWLHPFADSLLRLKRLQAEVTKSLEGLRDLSQTHPLPESVSDQIAETLRQAAECRQFLADRTVDLEMHDRRSANLSHRLYREVLRCRMRPFGEGIRRFPRMVRDLARALGKEVRLEVQGEDTQVDRDILDKLEATLGHLLRNAVDHGCETPAERLRAGKPAEATVRLEARHCAGMLQIIVADDGAGIQPGRVRENILRHRLASPAAVEKLSEPELLEFLLLPGFTMRDTVTEISGRGVGLDVVQNMVKSVRGTIRIATQPGNGMRFQLHLPLSLSVLRTLLVEVADEPYAIPLAQISRTLKLPRAGIHTLQGRSHFTMGDQQIGLLTAHRVLERGESRWRGEFLPVVVLGERANRRGLVVDRFLGERELVAQPLDARLGKVKNISAGALMEDGSPVLIMDVEDLVRSMEKLAADEGLNTAQREASSQPEKRAKRILIVDDSMTVRELERKLLAARNYATEVAMDGLDGWNAARSGQYDLVITDVDMPRMDGIELARLIKGDARLKSLPVMIVSYKDREEDRMRGLAAGADYYLTKGSFHDETLVRAVVDLIGEAEA